MKRTILHVDLPMDLLSQSRRSDTDDHRIFYLSSCESGTGIDTYDSQISPRDSSISSISSLDIELSTPVSTTHANIFLRVLQRLHRLTLRRRRHGRFRSYSSSLHLFFKRHHKLSSIDLYRSTNYFCKSSSMSQFSSPTIEYSATDTHILHKRHSCPYLSSTGVNRDRHVNSKTTDRPLRTAFLRSIRISDNTVSEDNNTNTLSSVDLTITPQLLPTQTMNDSKTSVLPEQQIVSVDLKPVSDLSFCFNAFQT
jgi:hypothetical protein